MTAPLTLVDLRHFAVARSLFGPTTLLAAIERLGFLQADPIRAPARAQDLILRPRVVDYRAGQLEAAYAELPVEEDFYVNYGFIPRATQRLMLPRKPRRPWSATSARRAKLILAFVQSHGEVHPRTVDAHFVHGSVINYWGGTSNATTHLLDAMHYRGLLRVARRERGVRIYAPAEPAAPASRAARKLALDRLVDVIVGTYAPLPALSLNALLSRLRFAAPQWLSDLRPAIARAKLRLAHALVEGVRWYWPADEKPEAARERELGLTLLAPFDPVVWDRRRFELFWGWPYRFEAYTPLAKRQFGYYALPLLWRGRALGWANLRAAHGELVPELGFAAGKPPRDRGFRAALDAELTRLRTFLSPD
ncbi:MAG TPA: crosslink repair DNA glycosylase YcaQ family protein [Polyangiales bacterium]